MDPVPTKPIRRNAASSGSPGLSSPSGPSPKEGARLRREASLGREEIDNSAAGTIATDALDIAKVAKETAKAAVEAASAQASEFLGHVGNELGESAEKQKQQGAEAIKGFARAIHRAGEEIDAQSPAISRQFHSVATHVETLSDSIREKNVRDLFASASSLARAQPAVFFAGAAVAGFVLARFIKSSALHQEANVTPSTPSAQGNGSWS